MLSLPSLVLIPQEDMLMDSLPLPFLGMIIVAWPLVYRPGIVLFASRGVVMLRGVLAGCVSVECSFAIRICLLALYSTFYRLCPIMFLLLPRIGFDLQIVCYFF